MRRWILSFRLPLHQKQRLAWVFKDQSLPSLRVSLQIYITCITQELPSRWITKMTIVGDAFPGNQKKNICGRLHCPPWLCSLYWGQAHKNQWRSPQHSGPVGTDSPELQSAEETLNMRKSYFAFKGKDKAYLRNSQTELVGIKSKLVKA